MFSLLGIDYRMRYLELVLRDQYYLLHDSCTEQEHLSLLVWTKAIIHYWASFVVYICERKIIVNVFSMYGWMHGVCLPRPDVSGQKVFWMCHFYIIIIIHVTFMSSINEFREENIWKCKVIINISVGWKLSLLSSCW